MDARPPHENQSHTAVFEQKHRPTPTAERQERMDRTIVGEYACIAHRRLCTPPMCGTVERRHQTAAMRRERVELEK